MVNAIYQTNKRKNQLTAAVAAWGRHYKDRFTVIDAKAQSHIDKASDTEVIDAVHILFGPPKGVPGESHMLPVGMDYLGENDKLWKRQLDNRLRNFEKTLRWRWRLGADPGRRNLPGA